MIGGLGQYYFTSFPYINSNFVISFFHDLIREKKGSGCYSNLVLFLYFNFFLESTFYYSFCNVLRIFFSIKKKIDIHTVNPTDHPVNEISYLFGPVVFPAIGIAQDFRFHKPTSPVLDQD